MSNVKQAISELAAKLVDYDDTDHVTFQERVHEWMMRVMGTEVTHDRVEQGDRLLEEVFELLQSGEYPVARVSAIRDQVWRKPIGYPDQEAGGVMICIAAYCTAHGLPMHEAGERELVRIWKDAEAIRAKHETKAHGDDLLRQNPGMAVMVVAQPVQDVAVMNELTGLRKQYSETVTELVMEKENARRAEHLQEDFDKQLRMAEARATAAETALAEAWSDGYNEGFNEGYSFQSEEAITNAQ